MHACMHADVPVEGEPKEEEPVSVDWPYGVLETVEPDAFYADVARAGIEYGRMFQMVQKASVDGRTVVLRCAVKPFPKPEKDDRPMHRADALGPHASEGASARLVAAHRRSVVPCVHPDPGPQA